MTMYLKSAALVAALVGAGPLSAKTLDVKVDMANFPGPPAYAAAYITDANDQYVATLYVAGRKGEYQADLRSWYRLIRRSGRGIDGTTGASVGRGGQFSTSVNVPDSMLNAGYKLHVETGVEDYGIVPDDVVVPLDDASNGAPVAGRRNVATATIAY
ncbi:DUF2271 domain-containing protein [Brevirhabdus sp.]|uniref:DUF2271 domain-containing protein n=1 Tax=Brevirhabdus sp. TaxID=2004514 RepID=UPI00405862C5